MTQIKCSVSINSNLHVLLKEYCEVSGMRIGDATELAIKNWLTDGAIAHKKKFDLSPKSKRKHDLYRDMVKDNIKEVLDEIDGRDIELGM